MKEALIMLITERLGVGNWDLLPTGDLYRIFNNLKEKEGDGEATTRPSEVGKGVISTGFPMF